jgi:hypothetical protein
LRLKSRNSSRCAVGAAKCIQWETQCSRLIGSHAMQCSKRITIVPQEVLRQAAEHTPACRRPSSPVSSALIHAACSWLAQSASVFSLGLCRIARAIPATYGTGPPTALWQRRL